ncbi:Cell division ATP-binding protein FtsE [[Clostridium] cellulosi]|uniref:Cell division ATP-binding protein FtsE n=1 Tax=[Clostridium] cellulosi TaxID=29343 RepID=A0A078KLC8_9FIRM|nr:Cell division ATP-binding protein FtsE [[Clostridium] cellulosi]
MIQFIDVYKVYENGTSALKNVNLTINDGEFVFIRGASGAGKSTLIKLLLHEETPSSGEVIVNGFKISEMKHNQVPKLRRTMGVVFQDFRLIPNMTVYDNVAFAMRVTGARMHDIRRRVPYILGLVGLARKAKCYPSELSGGEQQRVSLARALVNNPSLIIADEPTGNIDPEMSIEIMELLDEINRRGTTIVMVTHDATLVEKYNYHRVITIESGNVAEDLPGSNE